MCFQIHPLHRTENRDTTDQFWKLDEEEQIFAFLYQNGLYLLLESLMESGSQLRSMNNFIVVHLYIC